MVKRTVVTPDQAGVPVARQQIVDDLTALSALSLGQLDDGESILVRSLDADFILDLTSALTADGITVLTTSGAGRWLRSIRSSVKWMSQTTWYIDPAAGDDENDGSSVGTAIKTLAEVARRLPTIRYSDYTFNVLGDAPTTDNIDFNPSIVPIEGQSDTARDIDINFEGGYNVLASGAVVAALPTDPGTNQPATLQDATINFATYVGKLVRLTSGALNGYFAVVLKDLGGNTARVSAWMTPSNGATVLTAPAPTDTFEVVQPYQIGIARHNNQPGRTRYFYRYVKPAGIAHENSRVFYYGCELNVSFGGAAHGSDNFTFYNGCAIVPTGGRPVCFDGRLKFTGCGIIVNDVVSQNTGRLEWQNSMLQGGRVLVGRGFTGASDTSTNQGNLGVFAGNVGLGIFDASAEGLRVTRFAGASIDAPLWGSGNAVGTIVEDGGKMVIRDGITPTLAAAGAEVDFDGIATPLPALEGSTTDFPAASALNTWAHWAGAPFSRNVLSYKSGACIVTAPSPVG